MATDVEKVRPNIRVEIHNNLATPMDIDEDAKSEEDGEIKDTIEDIPLTDDSQGQSVNQSSNKVWSRKAPFTTGINIFDKEEQSKLQERAKRFALKPNEINIFSDEDLQQLRESLGITSDNESNVRFEAIHMRGINLMNTEDVLEYFAKYAPTLIEWVCEDSCNVVWSDVISAARALHYISRVVKGMPVRGGFEASSVDFILEDEEQLSRSILLKNKDREVELSQDGDFEMNNDNNNKLDLKNMVDISAINIPIPPGYWRLGEENRKAKSLLLRFAIKTDKQPFKTENFSRYYKKFGNLFGGIKSISSENKSHHTKGIFSRNKELNRDKNVVDKNPWGVLAKNWNEDAKFRERVPVYNNKVEEVEPEEEVQESVREVLNPRIRSRLGLKRKLEEPPRASPKSDSEESLKSDPEDKQSKIPRMRMYADDEEEKIKRKRLLQTIKKQTEQIAKNEIQNSDLRNILRITNQKPKIKTEPDDDQDLGASLKNRSRKLVFTVAQELENSESENRYEDQRLETRRMRSPVYNRRPISPIQYSSKESDRFRRHHSRERHRSSDRRSPNRRRDHSRRRTPERRYGRMYSSRNDSDDDFYKQKTRSKVAVVIKTPKVPTVASSVQSRVNSRRRAESSSGSSSESSDSSDSEESSSEDSTSNSDEETESPKHQKAVRRPGFGEDARHKLSRSNDHKTPLKVEISNEHYRRK